MIGHELELILHEAFVGARNRRHRVISVEHLLLGLLDSPTVRGALERCSVQPDDLRRELSDHLARWDQADDGNVDLDTLPTMAFQQVIQRAILGVQSAGKKEVAVTDVLMAILAQADTPAVRMLIRRGVGAREVLDCLGDGDAKTLSPPTRDLKEQLTGSEVQVVLYNDDDTPMEFVVRVLRELFGMSKDEAVETMLEVHREGAAVCGLYAHADGVALVQEVERFARDHGHPLKCAAVAPKSG